MHMDKWNTQFMLCSMRGTKIARVEGLWLVSRPNHSVSENPDNSPEDWVCSPFIVPSQDSMRGQCDIISWGHDCLLWSFSGKTTEHAHQKHCSSSMHPPVSMPESPVAIDVSKPLCLFLNPNSLPVTLSPRYFSVPSYQSLNLFTHFQQNTGRYNKQGWWTQCIDSNIKEIKLGK